MGSVPFAILCQAQAQRKQEKGLRFASRRAHSAQLLLPLILLILLRRSALIKVISCLFYTDCEKFGSSEDEIGPVTAPHFAREVAAKSGRESRSERRFVVPAGERASGRAQAVRAEKAGAVMTVTSFSTPLANIT